MYWPWSNDFGYILKLVVNGTEFKPLADVNWVVEVIENAWLIVLFESLLLSRLVPEPHTYLIYRITKRHKVNIDSWWDLRFNDYQKVTHFHPAWRKTHVYCNCEAWSCASTCSDFWSKSIVLVLWLWKFRKSDSCPNDTLLNGCCCDGKCQGRAWSYRAQLTEFYA